MINKLTLKQTPGEQDPDAKRLAYLKGELKAAKLGILVADLKNMIVDVSAATGRTMSEVAEEVIGNLIDWRATL